MLRGDVVAPLVVFKPFYSLAGDCIGPGALHAVRFVGAVKINQHPMSGSPGDNLMVILTIHWSSRCMKSTLMPFTPHSSNLSLIHISEPTRRTPISYAVFCLKKKNIASKVFKKTNQKHKFREIPESSFLN